jgi:hypothetical protein
MICYEQLLDRDLRWALREGSMHFEKDNAVHRTLQKITRQRDELGVPYAVAGGMALFLLLPTWDWWELLGLTPEQLRQQLQAANTTGIESPPQKVSGQDVAA